MGIKTLFTGPSLRPLASEIEKATALFKSPRPLLSLFGAVAVRQIQENFRAGGNPKWAPLKPGTLAGRRAGNPKSAKGGGNKGPQPLRDTGAMARGWSTRNVRLEDKSITIYNPDPKAVFHEFGTGTFRSGGKYPIVPRRGQALALPAIERDQQGRVKGQYTLAGLGRSPQIAKRSFLYEPTRRGGVNLFGNNYGGKAVKNQRFAGRAGLPVAPYRRIDFFAGVMHPGVPARPVVPTNAQILPKLKTAADRFFAINLFARLERTTKQLPKLGSK